MKTLILLTLSIFSTHSPQIMAQDLISGERGGEYPIKVEITYCLVRTKLVAVECPAVGGDICLDPNFCKYIGLLPVGKFID